MLVKFILFLILGYIFFRAIGVIIRYFLRAGQNSTRQEGKPPKNSKYKDVQEAEFREIKKDNE